MTIKKFRVALATIAIFASSTISAIADPVTLSAHDGSAEITGELISFVDGVYTVATPFGSVQMSVLHVTCVGETCPVLIANSDDTPNLN